MKAGFIGAGKAGVSLGKYFVNGGIEVTGYYSKSMESAKWAAEFTGTKTYTKIEQIIKDSDTLFITVPDGQIGLVWEQVKAYPIESKCICHCSGSLTSAVFSEIDQKQAFGYSIHPLFAIRSRTESYKELSQAFFTIEGHLAQLAKFRQLFEQLGNPVQQIEAGAKVKYHAAAVWASNQVTALFYTATELLQECGFSEAAALRCLEPLFMNNCQNIVQNGVVDALTGPVERGDTKTISRHLECLSEEDRMLYVLLSQKLTDIAKKKHEGRDYSGLKSLLEQEKER